MCSSHINRHGTSLPAVLGGPGSGPGVGEGSVPKVIGREAGE